MGKALVTFRDKLRAVNYRTKMISAQKNTYSLSAFKRFKAALHGFTADEYVIYDLDHHDRRNYLPEYKRFVFRDRVSRYSLLFDNKLVFYHLVRSFLPVNTVFSSCIDGSYIALEPGWEQEKIIAQLKSLGRLVFKKLSAGGGEGFVLLEYKDGSFFRNRSVCTAQDITALLEHDSFLLEEYCVQCEFENNIWKYSVNTLRVITLLRPGHTAYVAAAYHRFGMDEHSSVDNANAGGIYAVLNTDTGVMAKAVCRAPERLLNPDGTIRDYSVHPVSQAKIEGVSVPGWAEIKKSAEAFHERLRFTGAELIAWDIALTDNGIRVIEANTSCTLKLMQTFGGIRHTETGKIICP